MHEGKDPETAPQMSKGEPQPPHTQMQAWNLDTWVDTKDQQGEEEHHDRMLRKEMRMAERKDGVHGPDRLNYAGGNRRGGNQCILYADDTTARVTGELWPELERKLERALDPLFRNLKENRVKVNEDKTGLMILGDRKARRKLIEKGGGHGTDTGRKEDSHGRKKKVLRANNLPEHELD